MDAIEQERLGWVWIGFDDSLGLHVVVWNVVHLLENY